MSKGIYIVVCVLIFVSTKAQVNLILNPSFEKQDSCPNNSELLSFANFWDNINPFPCSSFLLNACCTNSINCGVPSYFGGGVFNYQWSRTGNSYCTNLNFSPLPPNLAYRNWRYYGIGTLNSMLINGKQYCGKVYINLSNNSPYKNNQFGMYFDDGSIKLGFHNCGSIINISPQIQNSSSRMLDDTLGWMKIEGVFTANGTESNVTFGNFKDDFNTLGIPTGFTTSYVSSIYNIDDLSLIATDITAYAGSDATICVNDSIHLGRPQEVGLECLWYKPTVALPFASISDIWFKPTQTGTYNFIQRMDNCAITWDTVNITVIQDCSLSLPSTQIPNVFTPNGDGVNDVFAFKINGTLSDFKIYNRWGLEIHQSILNQQSIILWDGRTTSGEACNEGVYFYTLVYKDNKGDTQKKNGYISLLR